MSLKPSLSKQLEKAFKNAAGGEEGKELFEIVPREQAINFEPEDGENFHVRISLDGTYEIGEGQVPFKRYYVSRMKSTWEVLNRLLTGELSFTDAYLDDHIEVYGEWDIRNWFGTLLRIAREMGART
jgi:hypothetical protein